MAKPVFEAQKETVEVVREAPKPETSEATTQTDQLKEENRPAPPVVEAEEAAAVMIKE